MVAHRYISCEARTLSINKSKAIPVTGRGGQYVFFLLVINIAFVFKK
jgi:hypothetical protein